LNDIYGVAHAFDLPFVFGRFFRYHAETKTILLAWVERRGHKVCLRE
jgi:hypothetical protein